MNRSPAFQFYPDKWQSHTRRLSAESYRVFHELLCWMWQHSPDYCSIEASPEAVACALAMPMECVRIAIAEINNPYAPLMRLENGRWVSNGLRKEAEKQNQRRNKAQASANSRWNQHAQPMQVPSDGNANASKTDAFASGDDANACSEQCFPIPSPSPLTVPKITEVPPLPPSIDEKGRESLDLEAEGVVESKTQSANLPTSPQSKRIATMFHRRLTTPWTRNEKHAYKQLGTIPEDDLAAVERYYSELWPPDREKNILRHDLVTFLRNFQGEVDRAHSYGRKAAKEPVKRESEFSANTIKRL